MCFADISCSIKQEIFPHIVVNVIRENYLLLFLDDNLVFIVLRSEKYLKCTISNLFCLFSVIISA